MVVGFGSDLLKFVEVDVGVGVFFRPCGVEGGDVVCRDDVGVCDALDVAESVIYVCEVFVNVFFLGGADVKVIVVGEPPFVGIVSLEIYFSAWFFAHEVGCECFELAADEVPCLVKWLPCAFKVEADAVALVFKVIPPASYIKTFGNFLVECFNDMSDPVSVLFLLFKTGHKLIESIDFRCFACNAVGAVAVICHCADV